MNNTSPSAGQRRKRSLLVFEDSSSDSSIENPAHRRRRKIYIQESDSESDSDSSFEFKKRKRVARVTSDSSDSSDSEIVRKVKKNARLESDSGNEESSGWESEERWETEDVPVQEPQPSSSKVVNLDEDNGSSSDSSDGQAEKCPICLISFKNQEVGSPEACDHSFCAECIQEWAKSVNTCPVDRRKFNLILVRSNYNGQYVRSIPVQEPTSNALGDPIEEEIDFTPCEVCGLSLNEDRLLLCDGCDLAYHLDCLEPPLSEVPEGEWFCPGCRNAELVDIDFFDLDFLLRDAERSNVHHRYSAPRLIPRTRQSERIRTRIVHQRGQTTDTNEAEATNDADALEEPGQVGPTTSRRRTTAPTTWKKPAKKHKRKCKKSRRKYKPKYKPKYKIVYEIDEATGEKVAIKKKTRRYKKRKTRKAMKRKIKVRRVLVPKSVKNRLARQLGICPPQRIGQSLPDMKVQVNPGDLGHRRSQAGIPTLHLFGQRDEIDYFSESESEIGGSGVNILVGRRPNISDSSVLRRAARNKVAALAVPSATTTSVDLLGSILDTQAKLHSKNSIISVRSDGSLKIDVDKKLPLKDKRANVQGSGARIRQTPMAPNTTTNGGSPNTSSANQYRDETGPNYENSVSTSTVGSSDMGGLDSYRGQQDDEGPQDYSLSRMYNLYDGNDAKDKKKNTEEDSKETPEESTPAANSDSELDIYSDIESVSTSKVEDSDVKYPSPAPVEAASVTNAADEDNESDTDLIIDTEKSDPDKYDPAAVFESDDEDTKEEAVTSTSEAVTTTKHSDFAPPAWNSSEIQSETVQSTNQNDFQHPSMLMDDKQMDEENEEPEDDDCPNFSIYSSESINLAKSTDLSMLIAPSDINEKEDKEENEEKTNDLQPITIPEENNVDVDNDSHPKPQTTNKVHSGLYSENNSDVDDDSHPKPQTTNKVHSGLYSENNSDVDNGSYPKPQTTNEVHSGLYSESNADVVHDSHPKPKTTKKVHSGLYSDSEDESVVKIMPQKPFGIGDIRAMTEDISEEERSYTPCLDEKEPIREGLEGLDTEMISDDDKNDFEEAQEQEREQELKTASDGDALEINAKESELDFTRPEDCEEGEIIDKLKSKRPEEAPKEPEDPEPSPKSKEKDTNNKEDEGSNKEPVFKKLSKNNKERNYRDKENKDRRSKSKEKKDKSNKENRKEKKKEKRKEIARYDVRTIVESKPKRDKFGRDPTRRRSYSSSKSATPPRRFGRDDANRRSGSQSSHSMTPRRFARDVRRRSGSYSSRSATPARRSLSRGRKSHSADRLRKRRARSLSRSKSRGRKRSRSRVRKRPQSSSRDRRKSRRASADRSKRKSRKAKTRSRSLSRRRDWEHRRSRGWSPSLSRSRSPEPRHFTPSWTPPRMMNQSVRPQNLTVILPNDSNKKRKEKRKNKEKKGKESNDKQKKRRRSDRSPPPSKEVFASGNNILVSVSFNKDIEERDERAKRRRDAGEELTTRRMRKEKERQGKTRVRRRVRNTSNIKPVAIIDLDRSPFKELTPSPKDVIILSDSDNADSNDLLGLQKAMRRDTSEQAASPEVSANNNYINSMGPKTPPEPQVKFSFTSKQPQLRQISNPLHEPDDVEEEIDPQEELENRLNEVMHKGPNTPPEPPNSPPSSPDAYDPFDPTKSRTPTPEPKLPNVQSSVTQSIEDTQEEPDRSTGADIEKNGTPTVQTSISKSHTPPIPIADIQPADSQSSVRAITPDTNLGSSPERPIGVVINQIVVQAQASVFPTVVSKPVAPTVYSSGSTSLITSTPVSTNLSVPRINILSSSVLTPPIVTSSVPQRIVLPNTTKSSPVNKVSPSKTPVKLTPIKPMPSKNIAKLPLPSAKAGWKNKNRNTDGNDANLDFDSPYSPGSSDYEDLFEPPPETTKSGAATKPAHGTKNTKSPSKNQNAFDALFGSSPVYTNKNKSKSKAKAKKSQHTSKGTKQVGVKLDEDNLKILDELPNSAVEMQVKDKFLKKLNRQERVVEEVKFVLKPYYNKKRVTKEEYKDILRRAVPKICHNKSGEINPKKIQQLVEAYVKKVRHSKKVTSSSSVNPQKTEVVSNWLSKLS